MNRSETTLRTHRWPRLTGAAVGLLAIVAFAGSGCADEPVTPKVAAVATTPAAPDNSASTGTGRADPTAYAQCMRTNGIANFPDPAEGRSQLPRGIDPNSSVFKTAHDKCKQFAGSTDGDSAPKQDSWPIADKLKYAKCMRDNGLPSFPDPDTTGRLEFDERIDPNGAAFKAAEKACSRYQPQGTPNGGPGGGPA